MVVRGGRGRCRQPVVAAGLGGGGGSMRLG
uniref:Uncharacterized protein n=1 Tax=Arundo donax TaxID=35708 RepID=A0A0A9AU36_ARUDO